MTSSTDAAISRKPIARSFTLSLNAFGPLLARAGARLLALHLLQAAFSQLFTLATEAIRDSGREEIALIAGLAILEMTVTMLWSAAWLLAIAEPAAALWHGRDLQSTGLAYGRSFMRHFNQIVIEQVRSLAAVLWRVPLLLIPAANEYIRLSFVPLVVILEPAYSEGTVDALQESRRLARGIFWRLSIVVSIMVTAPWVAQSFAQGEGSELIWENPIGVAIGWVGTFFINVFVTVYLCAFYGEIRARKETPARRS